MLKFPLVRASVKQLQGPVASRKFACRQVVEAFLKLDKPYQAAIADVTMKMGAGMAEFIEKEVRLVATLTIFLNSPTLCT